MTSHLQDARISTSSRIQPTYPPIDSDPPPFRRIYRWEAAGHKVRQIQVEALQLGIFLTLCTRSGSSRRAKRHTR